MCVGGGGGDFPGHKIRTGGCLNIKYVSFEYLISMHNLNGWQEFIKCRWGPIQSF